MKIIKNMKNIENYQKHKKYRSGEGNYGKSQAHYPTSPIQPQTPYYSRPWAPAITTEPSRLIPRNLKSKLRDVMPVVLNFYFAHWLGAGKMLVLNFHCACSLSTTCFSSFPFAKKLFQACYSNRRNDAVGCSSLLVIRVRYAVRSKE